MHTGTFGTRPVNLFCLLTLIWVDSNKTRKTLSEIVPNTVPFVGKTCLSWNFFEC